MYIRIINKNRIDTDNEYTDFARFNIDEGSVYTQIYGEELDSWELRVSNLQSQLEIEPFDRVAIYDDNDNIINVMDVESYTCDMQGYIGDATYTYDIVLCSMTKELEGYILPNLSITPRKIGTRKTVYEYIVQYRDLFAPSILIDTELSTLFNNLAPELQWNEPTLREVLTSLMMTKDCIPIMTYKNNAIVLSYMDLTKKGDEVTGYNFIRTSRSMSDYESELRMTMQNVMQPDSVTTTTEYFTFTSNDYILNSDNVVLKTKFPILNIKHLWMGVYNVGGNLIFRELDLTNAKNISKVSDTGGSLVYEKAEYDTLRKLYRFTNSPSTNERVDNFLSKYQNFCVYYTRGNNVIEGFSNLTRVGSIGSTEYSTLQQLQALVSLSSQTYMGGTAVDNAYYSCYFKIEYETMYDQVFQASKERYQNHHRVIADNQQFSWVDANTQASLEYQKANRLGNEVVLINMRDGDIELGDTLNDSIVYKVEKQYYTNHIDINAYATKDYILRDKFTAIDAKIRTYVNAQNEAFIRSDLHKFYCVFKKYAQNDMHVNYAGLSQALVSPLDQQAHNESIKYCAIDLWDSDEFVQLDLLKRQLDKSMVFSFGFNDNWITGLTPNISITNINANFPAIDTSYTSASDGGIELEPIQYTDSNGELQSVKYHLASNMYNSWDDVNDNGVYLNNTTDIDIIRKGAVWCFNKPIVIDDAISEFVKFSDEVSVYKDNKEIPMFNIQFEFISDDNDIMVTPKWVELQKWLNDYDIAKQYTIYNLTDSTKWNFRSNALPSQATQLVGATIQIDYSQNNRAKITISGGNANDYHYIVIDGEVVLAFKGLIVYMNILSKRDQNTYNAKGVIVNG